MSKRLRYMTPVHCPCGAKGDMIWEEDDSNLQQPENFQIVSITELFSATIEGICCRLCDREIHPIPLTTQAATRSEMAGGG